MSQHEERRADQREALIRELREVNERLLVTGMREQELSEGREELLEWAREATEAKANFLSLISHELRTPLTAIMGYVDVLGAADPDGRLTDMQKEQVRRIKVSALHLLQLIEEILAYSRMGPEEDRVESQRVDISELLRNTAWTVEPLFAAKGIDFDIQPPERPLSLETDRGKVRHILLNLLSNAAKFTESGKVTVRAWDDDDSVFFEVRDTGVGIPPEHLESIFDPFWQVEDVTTRRAEGTGLGLTVARRLARVLGGELGVDSRPGVGSTFTIRLPVSVRVAAS